MDVDAIAEEMLEDSDDDVKLVKEAARPARRAATKPKQTYDFHDDEDDFEENSDESQEASFEDDDD